MNGRTFLLGAAVLFGLYLFYNAVLTYGWFNIFVGGFVIASSIILLFFVVRVFGGGVNG